LLALSKGAEYVGFKTLALNTTLDKLENFPLPFIVFFLPSHFVVVYKITRKSVYVSDPSFGLIKYSKKEFTEHWTDKTNEGSVLLLETTEDFYKKDAQKERDKIGFKFLFNYFFLYKQLISQLLIGVIITTVFSVLFPFLTQSLVDVGINQKNLDFVYMVLLAQLILFISQSVIGFIRNWIFLHIATKVNISLVSDFLFKLMRLPIIFIENRTLGDIYQRIFDLNRLQSFISSTTFNFFFSFLSLFLFGFVLISYSLKIFLIFLIGSVIGILWILLFLNKRKELDYKQFYESSSSQNAMVQILTGMREIKLSGAENQKRGEWEKIQAKIFGISIKSMYWSQIQISGSMFFNQFKNILITFIAATQVINGEITLGMMMAITYIIGQLSAPIEQLISIIQLFQDAKISLSRVSEVYGNEEEENPKLEYSAITDKNRCIYINNVSFKYQRNDLDYILRNLSLKIPENKTTAIVGSSGSGKTTIIKLLLKFYSTSEGNIKIGKTGLSNLKTSEWRKICGSVMQDGYIFSDTISNNITLGNNNIDRERLETAIRISNIDDFLDKLPKGLETNIGMMGEGISQGQKQRILIARVIYKNPDYVFFDEATSDLDSENESIIMDNLISFCKNKTVLVVAHRLSTVKNADNIAVLEGGTIIEEGKHDELVKKRGSYYRIFKSQILDKEDERI
jgi:ATP-binding cassette subfamily B protein